MKRFILTQKLTLKFKKNVRSLILQNMKKLRIFHKHWPKKLLPSITISFPSYFNVALILKEPIKNRRALICLWSFAHFIVVNYVCTKVCVSQEFHHNFDELTSCLEWGWHKFPLQNWWVTSNLWCLNFPPFGKSRIYYWLNLHSFIKAGCGSVS